MDLLPLTHKGSPWSKRGTGGAALRRPRCLQRCLLAWCREMRTSSSGAKTKDREMVESGASSLEIGESVLTHGEHVRPKCHLEVVR